MFDKTVTNRAVILTALQVEYEAIKHHLANLREEIHLRGNIYHRGIFSSPGGAWEIGIGQIGEGNSGASAAIERAITHFEPEIVLFVGVAGGIKDVGLYDIVVGEKIYSYESGKDEETFFPRPEVSNPSYSLLQRAKVLAGKRNWMQRIHGPKPTVSPRVLIKPIAAGEKVVASTKSAIFQFLRQHYSDAVAVEMEGHGFLAGVEMNESVRPIVIRGISDLIDNKHEVEIAHNSQAIAACYASAFAFELIANLHMSPTQNKDSREEKVSIAARSLSQVTEAPSQASTQVQATYTKDFLVSYTPNDGFWANWVDAHLREEGYSTILLPYEAASESTSMTSLNEAMNTARRIIVLLSQDYLSTIKGPSSWIMQRRGEMTERILPICVRKCPYSKEFSGYDRLIDFVGKSEAEAHKSLLKNLQ